MHGQHISLCASGILTLLLLAAGQMPRASAASSSGSRSSSDLVGDPEWLSRYPHNFREAQNRLLQGGDQNQQNGKDQEQQQQQEGEGEDETDDGSSSSKLHPAGQQLFVDSRYTSYDGYQQAWRMLGFFVDCQDYPAQGKAKCARYLLWAAYVDKNYQGGGTGEYSYWDPYSSSYDESACYTHGNGRCAKMDCHEETSETWELLGVFKEYYYSTQWFEQLFKHEGYCLWNSDQYKFMQTYAYYWPESCTQSKLKDSNGKSLYLGLKPIADANMTVALYTDSDCAKEYSGKSADISKAVAAGDKVLYGENLVTWNNGMDYYKYCQPCRAYKLHDNGQYQRRMSDSGWIYYKTMYGDGGADNDENDGYFACGDAAGYMNVNQCMKFGTHTIMEPASWKDLELAQQQGGLLRLSVGDTSFGSPKSSLTDAILSSMVQSSTVSATSTAEASAPPTLPWLIVGGCSVLVGFMTLMGTCVWRNRKRREEASGLLNEPLMTNPNASLA